MTSNIKTITIDDFYSKEQAFQLCSAVYNLQYSTYDFGKQIDNFNLSPPDSNQLFSNALNMKMEVDEESGIFRIPENFVHFEPFEDNNDWIFVVALQQSTFNIFEHKTGVKSAREEYRFNYRNLFEWDLMVNYVLKPGQGVLFRPWLFHSFDTGLIQVFKLNEKL
jgi:hypothetical protein